MTDFDMFCLSLGINVALLARLWAKQELIKKMEDAMAAMPPLMAAIADGHAMPYRTSKNEVKIRNVLKEKANGN
jgi:hypothetical protein